MLARIVDFALTQRLLVLVLTALLIGAGVVALRELPIDAFPDVSTTQVKIIVKAPGMTPEEVESRITIPIEQELLGIERQRLLRAVSKYGITDVTVDFEDGTDIYWARQQVAERFAAVAEALPAQASGGLAPITTPLSDLYMFTIEGPLSLEGKRTLLDRVVRPQLRTVRGVADVNSLGGFGEDRGFCYLQGQRVVSVPMRRAASKVAFPEPIGQVTTMLIYAEEIVRLALRHDIDTARVYGANIGPRAALVCLLAKLLRLYRSPGDVDRGARWLAAASARDLRKQAPAYGIRAALRYRDDDGGGSDSAVLVLSDTYRATGTVVGIAAQCLLDGEGPAAGVFMLHEAVPPERFMQRLQAQGLVRIAHEDRGAAVAAAQVSA